MTSVPPLSWYRHANIPVDPLPEAVAVPPVVPQATPAPVTPAAAPQPAFSFDNYKVGGGAELRQRIREHLLNIVHNDHNARATLYGGIWPNREEAESLPRAQHVHDFLNSWQNALRTHPELKNDPEFAAYRPKDSRDHIGPAHILDEAFQHLNDADDVDNLGIFRERFHPALANMFSARSNRAMSDEYFSQEPKTYEESMSRYHAVRAARQLKVDGFQNSIKNLYKDLHEKHGVSPSGMNQLLRNSPAWKVEGGFLGQVMGPQKAQELKAQVDAAKATNDPAALQNLWAEWSHPKHRLFGSQNVRGYPISERAFNEMVQGNVPLDKIDDGRFVRQAGMAAVTDLSNQVRGKTSERINQLERKHTIAPRWSDANFHTAPISMDEVYSGLGYTWDNHPTDPYDRLDLRPTVITDPGKRRHKTQSEMTPQELQMVQDNQEHNRRASVDALRDAIIEGNWENKDIRSIVTNPSSSFGPDSDKMISYIYKTLCDTSMDKFEDLLDQAGFPDLKDNLRAKTNSTGDFHPDTEFDGYGMSFGSSPEKQCVDLLRKLGLSAIPYRLAVPSIQDCPTNKRRFVVDFLIPCDLITRWDMKTGPDGRTMPHPQIQRRVVFVGEYFGYQNTTTFPLNRPIIGIDGQPAKTSKGQPMTPSDDPNNPTMVSGSDMYNTKSDWKRMMESFAANATGNRSIFVDAFQNAGDEDRSLRQIMAQLDGKEVLYRSPFGDDGSTGVAMHQLEQHIAAPPQGAGCQLGEPMCDARAYLHQGGPQPMSKAEAYIRASMANLEVRHGFTPMLQQLQAEGFSREEIYQYYDALRQVEAARRSTYAAYQASRAQGSPDSRQKLHDYQALSMEWDNLHRSQLARLMTRYQKQLDSNPMYKIRRAGLEDLLQRAHLASQEGVEPPGQVIRKSADRFVYGGDIASGNPDGHRPTKGPTTASTLNHWYRLGVEV